MYRIEFELPGLPGMTNRASGASNHWRRIHSERSAWRDTVACYSHAKRPKKPLARAHLTLIRFSFVCPDPDGLVSGFKAVIDGLVAGGVLVNDKFTNIGMPIYRWEQVPKGKGKIRVIVEQLPLNKEDKNGQAVQER